MGDDEKKSWNKNKLAQKWTRNSRIKEWRKNVKIKDNDDADDRREIIAPRHSELASCIIQTTYETVWEAISCPSAYRFWTRL